MDRFHRYYYLHRILTSRRLPVSRAALERDLECSRATINRIIDELRNIGAPIEYVRAQNGYRYAPGAAFELPGIWFSPSELEALFDARAGSKRGHADVRVSRTGCPARKRATYRAQLIPARPLSRCVTPIPRVVLMLWCF